MYFSIESIARPPPTMNDISLLGEKVKSHRLTENIMMHIQRHFSLYSTLFFSDADGNILPVNKSPITVMDRAFGIEIKPYKSTDFYLLSEWFIGEYCILINSIYVTSIKHETFFRLKDTVRDIF